jgi:hypothetical protein
MEKRLDEHDGRLGSYWWKGILLALALLLIGTLGAWLLLKPDAPAQTSSAENHTTEVAAAPASDTGSSENGITENEKTQTQHTVADTPLAEPANDAGNRDSPTGKDASTRDKGRDGPTRVKRAETPPATGAKKYRAERLSARGKTPVRPRNRGSSNTGEVSNETTRSRSATAFTDGKPGQGEEENVVPVPKSRQTDIPAPGELPELALLTGKPVPVEVTALGRPTVPPPVAATSPEIEPTPKKGTASRLSIGAMVSPDLSSIGFFNRLTPGTNVGVQLEYRLGSRFRVGLGGIYSVKLYEASVEDYTVPKGFWTYGVKPSGIDATCKILDLPVHLRFDAVQRQRYNLFLATGLSSYIMLSERYNYTYPVPDYKLRPYWSGKRTGEYYFSVVNLSAGYERSLSRNFSWQVEPFLKLPLGGVGFGKVKLISSGVFLSVKYKITRTKR